MNLEENVQKYIKIEDEIKKRLTELNKLREYKTSITSLIIADLEKDKHKESKDNKEKGHYTYVSRINGNIKIKMVELKTYTPLTFTFLKKCLLEIIPKSHQVDQIIEYVKTKRESKIISDIKRMN
jgi:nitrogen regulatory protein PII